MRLRVRDNSWRDPLIRSAGYVITDRALVAIFTRYPRATVAIDYSGHGSAFYYSDEDEHNRYSHKRGRHER